APALSAGTTYYWRVKAQDANLVQTGFSNVNVFYVDAAAPTVSNMRVLNSTGGAISESQFTTLAIGATSQLTVQDSPSGLAVSPSTLPYFGDGHDDPGSATGFSVMYST